MFELPDAKRVRREDLNGSDESGWSDSGDDAELETRLNAQIAKSLGLDADSYRAPWSQPAATKAPTQSHGESSPNSDAGNQPETLDDTHGEEEDEEEGGGEPGDAGYTFRLFSTAGPAPKVVLEDENEEMQEGGLVRGRPLSYYLATEVSTEKKRRYEDVAVSGADVMARSRWRCWGLELPWRVTTIEVTRKATKTGAPSSSSSSSSAAGEPSTKRRRPGKKRRIAMRVKARAKAHADEEAAKKVADKEEHLKEKKKRLNRLKKLRKRAKNKGKKQAGEGGGDGGESDGDSSAAE